MAHDWTPAFVLPNVALRDAIEGGVIALAPEKDPRIVALKRAHPRFRTFLGRFSDNFGQRFEPVTLLLRADAAPALLEVASLAGFRDAVAIAAITYNRALELRQPRGHRILFGEAFAIYPWMLDRHYEDMIGNTPALLGTHDVDQLRGQSSPSLFRMPLSPADIDEPLLEELLVRWRRRFEASSPDWEDIALFRSLNMAYHASLLPAGTDTTFHDIGRLVALWVSAFEILVHPGGNGRADLGKVFELLERTPWAIQSSGALAHDTGGKTKIKRTLASWLYQALYQCRNDFLHGNPVARADLFLPASGRTVFEYAAPLYRIALTSFLPLTLAKPAPPASDAEAFGAYIAARMAFRDPQKRAEEALRTAVQPASSP
jgi:hypothetical protein